jgi:hypothetical protein
MLFEGQDLREVLGATPNPIELRNEYGRCHRMLSRDEALALDLDLFIGIGNRRRDSVPSLAHAAVRPKCRQPYDAAPEKPGRKARRPPADPGAPTRSRS